MLLLKESLSRTYIYVLFADYNDVEMREKLKTSFYIFLLIRSRFFFYNVVIIISKKKFYYLLKIKYKIL